MPFQPSSKRKHVFLLNNGEARLALIRVGRTSHHPAVAPGQSQRDTLSMLDHCWKVFRIPFFGKKYFFVQLRSVEQSCCF